MTRRLIPTIILVAAGLCPGTAQTQTGGGAPSQSPAPARDQAATATGTSSIKGLVTDEATGSPLRRASVRLSGGGLREVQQVTTDVSGRYAFQNLPAGSFNINVTRSGYVSRSYGQRRSQEIGKTVTVQPRQAVENIDVSLPRGALMTGKVVDEYGEPMADTMVMIARLVNSGGTRRPMMVTSRQTDDLGEFRMAGLSGGEYQVSATIRNFNPGVSTDRAGYAPTYYPGTPNPAEAQLVRVSEGQLVSGLTIVLIPTRVAQISGSAIDSEGQIIKRGSVSLSQRGSVIPVTFSGAQIRPDGTFMLSSIPPGDYQLTVSLGPEGREVSIAEVSVNGADISNVLLAPPRQVSISGRLLIDPAVATWPSTDNVRITAMSIEGNVGFRGPMTSEPLHQSTTFTMNSPTGRVRLAAQGLPAGWTVSRATAGGIDVTDELTIGSRDIPDLSIEITNRMPGLSGAVSNTRGELVADAFVLIFPQDTQRWAALTPGRSALLRADAKGEFRMRSIRPGSYFVAAVTSLDADQWNDPVYLDTLVGRATRITLADTDQRRVDLRIDER